MIILNKYKEIRDVRNLFNRVALNRITFNQSTDEDYYKPIKTDETHNMHTKSDNIETIMGSETNDIFEELRKSLLQKYQEGLEESLRGSEFIIDSINLLYYHLQKISLKRSHR